MAEALPWNGEGFRLFPSKAASQPLSTKSKEQGYWPRMHSLPPWITRLEQDVVLWLKRQAIRAICGVLLLLAAGIALLFSLWAALFFALEPRIGVVFAALLAGASLSVAAGFGAWLAFRTRSRSPTSSSEKKTKPREEDRRPLSSLDGVLYALVLGVQYGRHLRNRHAAKEKPDD